jgi:hypothetical protein
MMAPATTAPITAVTTIKIVSIVPGPQAFLCSHLVLVGLAAPASASCCSNRPMKELSDEEIAADLRLSIAVAGRLSRQADLFLAGVGAEHWVDGLRAAGLLVIRPVRWELHR